MPMLTLPKLATQFQTIHDQLAKLAHLDSQAEVEASLSQLFATMPDHIRPDSTDYYGALNAQLYRYILKSYKQQESGMCIWRYIKNLSPDQLNYQPQTNPTLDLLDALLRVYFYSDPLDDLTCVFIPINDGLLIKKYLHWIKNYFYNADYPTSLLWLYALDSSLASLFPDEVIYLGKRLEDDGNNILLPDLDYKDAVLFKRYSPQPNHFVKLEGVQANNEFRQIFTFLQREYKDRCLSRSVKQSDYHDEVTWQSGWEKFEDVLRFGVSDKNESGCISFSDLRSSTEFLNGFGKSIYLNKIQQPFFEQTQIISQHYNGRIDKFMGDNVMCVFLDNNMAGETEHEQAIDAILNNFFALFALCKVLYEILLQYGFETSKLGLRSGVAYGNQILRSNLGNEFVRDFTVTGEKVNLAARLEHISISELIIHNQTYFAKAIERFPQINDLISIGKNYPNLNPETKAVVREYTLYQNIISNLEKLNLAKFDIRMNEDFYLKLRQHLLDKGYIWLNPDTATIYGYEAFQVGNFELQFYMSYYNPKGFSGYQTIWLLPLEIKLLVDLDIEQMR